MEMTRLQNHKTLNTKINAVSFIILVKRSSAKYKKVHFENNNSDFVFRNTNIEIKHEYLLL